MARPIARLVPALAVAALMIASDGSPLTQQADGELTRWATDTWHSFVALVDPGTGLPADNIDGDLAPASRARYTSPTNIAMYLWATVGARDLGLISPTEASDRIGRVLDELEGLERHAPSGQFYNWYDPSTGAKLTEWPKEPHDVIHPFLSSVDNGWLASALLIVAAAVPELRDRAQALARSMNFGCYYDAGARGPDAAAGMLRGGFWRIDDAPPDAAAFPRGDYCAMGETVVYTDHHYSAFNSEPRIASYLGIALGQIPAAHYFGAWRTYPDTCEWSWQEQRPVGRWQRHLGVDVFEGAYRYRNKLVVPTWGGSMFEALMPALVVPEEAWGGASWGVTHPLFVESQIEYGLDEAGYGYWGFSPSSDPAGGYREYGMDQLGLSTDGYTSDEQRRTDADLGWDDPACPREARPIADYGSGVVSPHAAFLALRFAPQTAVANLRALEKDFPGLYGPGGFKDAVGVSSGTVADRYLALDEGMVMAALTNALTGDGLRAYLAPALEPALRSLMELETFAAGRVVP